MRNDRLHSGTLASSLEATIQSDEDHSLIGRARVYRQQFGWSGFVRRVLQPWVWFPPRSRWPRRLEESMAGVADKLNVLTRDVAGLDAKVAAAGSEVGGLNDKLAALSRELAGLNQSLNAAQTSLASQQREQIDRLTVIQESASKLEREVGSEAQSVREQAAALTAESRSALEQLDRALAAGRDDVRSIRPAIYLGDNIALTRTRFGHKIYVDTVDIGIGPHILLDGMWEEWITSFIAQQLRPGMVFVDIGAHIGWFTLLACSKVQPSGRVFAIEPQPRLASLLRSSISINGYSEHVEVLEVAALDTEGPAILFQKHNDSGKATLIPTGEGYTMQTEVATVTLDRLLEHGPVDFIKIDAEGAEAKILGGAQRIIGENRDIQLLIEYHSGHEEALSDLSKSGFRLGYIEHDGTLRPIEVNDVSSLPVTTMIYAKR